MFSTWLSRWKLIPDGVPIETHTSHLLPVTTIHGGKKAILKLTDDDSERTGCQLMAWWNGKGAARVLAHENGAILLERATGVGSLAEMSRSGEDAQACRLICHTARRLHVAPDASTPELTPLEHWFRDLEPVALLHGGIMLRCALAAKVLLSCPQDVVVLHGDVHHGNVLDFAESGWLAIDPKGLLGERGFDYANIFTNPDLADLVLASPLIHRGSPSASTSFQRLPDLNASVFFCGSRHGVGFLPPGFCKTGTLR